MQHFTLGICEVSMLRSHENPRISCMSSRWLWTRGRVVLQLLFVADLKVYIKPGQQRQQHSLKAAL